MFSQLAVTGLLALTASAAPWGAPQGTWEAQDGQVQTGGAVGEAQDGQVQSGNWGGQGGYPHSGPPPQQSGKPGSPAPPAQSGPQVPFKFPLANGFPNVQPGTPAIQAIYKQAHGTLPNGALPTKIADASATTLQLIAFNEIFETAYFTSLLNNITTGVYDTSKSGLPHQAVIDAITAVQAQEELHALGANGILQSAGRTTVQPCEYTFPVSDFDSAIALAATFTDVVLGTLQDAQNTFGTDGDTELLALIGSVIGQEGEQDGYYRTISTLGGKIPSALPFLTRSVGPFAFSVLNQDFVVPGSCGNIQDIDIPIFGALNVLTQNIQPVDQDLQFSWKKPTTTSTNPSDLHIVYINQQNVPVVQPFKSLQVQGDEVLATAAFPFSNTTAYGLTIAAVTKNAGPFASAGDVAAATLFGPGLISID